MTGIAGTGRTGTGWMLAAAIPYRVRKGRVEIALVTSRRRRRWILPKGRIETGEPAHACAAREAREEAGLVGTVADEALCTWTRRTGEQVLVHLLAVSDELDEWPEHRWRRRRWVALAKVQRLVRGRRLEAVFVEAGRVLAVAEGQRGAA